MLRNGEKVVPSVSEFLIKLSESISLAEQYKLDPEKVMRNEGLSAPAIAILRGGDPMKIRNLLSVTEADGDTTVVVVVIVAP